MLVRQVSDSSDGTTQFRQVVNTSEHVWVRLRPSEELRRDMPVHEVAGGFSYRFWAWRLLSRRHAGWGQYA